MIDRSKLWVGGGGVALVAACCGIPLLASLLGTAGIAALLAWGVPILLPAVGLVIVVSALVFYLRFRRGSAPSATCDGRPGAPERNLR